MIRAYQRSDMMALTTMFRQQGFQYDFPDPNSPEVLSKMVLEKDGKVAMAILARVTAEAYFLIDPEFGAPLEKWETFKELHEASRLDCYARGLDDIFCWVPPKIAKPFGRRLMRIGWGRNEWPSFTRSLHEKTIDLKEEVCAAT